MNLAEKIQLELIEALKAKDEVKVRSLRYLMSTVKNAQIAKGSELSDEEIIAQITKDAKSHQESIEAYKRGNRQDLVEREEAELKVIQSYLPEQLPDVELKAIVEEAITKTGASQIKDMGKVIGIVMGKAAGRADGGRVAQIVKDILQNNA